MATLLKDAPVLMVRDVVASAEYWRDKVGFGFNEMWGDPPDFTMVHRDRLTVFLAKPDQPGTPITPNWKVKDKMWNIYFWVDDARALYEQHQGPNMTPMVDVVMVILIFFMASASLLGPEVLLRARLAEREPERSGIPGAGPVLSVPTFRIRLVDAGGAVAVSGMGLRRAPLDRLENAALTAFEQLERFASGVETLVVVEAADEVPYEAVIAAQDILRRSGFERIGIR